MIRIIELKMSLEKTLTKELEMANLRKLIKNTIHISDQDIISFSISKKAVDARKKENVHFVYSVDLLCNNEDMVLSTKHRFVSKLAPFHYPEVKEGIQHLNHRPIIVGFGPSGMFAALLLSRRGYRPIVLERGLNVDQRAKLVHQFTKSGAFHEHGTILFGEGGAGTFSDGKLTTLISDFRCRYVLESLVKGGADEEILYRNKPHVGTDVLRSVIKNLREEIISHGGEIRFGSQVSDIVVKDSILQSVVVNETETLSTDVCLLGIGHSARNTFQMLFDRQVEIRQKPFSIGVRIEHPQSMINSSQYGEYASHPSLGPAEYKLSYHAASGRSAYSFCMCPGGWVVCSSSETEGVLTNGMSENARDGEYANSALMVNVTPEDFGSDHPLAGVEFQRRFENKAFDLAGRNFHAPIQLVGDFLSDRHSTALGIVKPTYRPGYAFVKMTDLFPAFVTDTLKEAILDFDRKIKGFAMHDAVLTGVETRSSSPIRIVRNDDFQSNISGLYPIGEGSGYAGGIMSSAVDGIRAAEKIIEYYHPYKG